MSLPTLCLVPRRRSLFERGARGVVGLLQAKRRPSSPALPVFPFATAPGDEAGSRQGASGVCGASAGVMKSATRGFGRDSRRARDALRVFFLPRARVSSTRTLSIAQARHILTVNCGKLE